MSDKLASLLKWVSDNGAEISPSLEFRDTADGISCFATSSPSGDELFTVPQVLAITPVLASDALGIQLKGNRNALTQLLLAKLRFHDEETFVNGRDLKSFFKPYLDILPTSEETRSPYFWGVERELLKGTDADIAVDKAIMNHLEEWYSVVQKLDTKFRPSTYSEEIEFYSTLKTSKPKHFAAYFNNPTSWMSFPAYLWSCAIFNSRAFPFILNSSKAQDLNEAFLLPVFDLLNHNNQKADVKWDFEDNQYIFKTKQVLEQGSEVFNSYGPKTNEELLLNYGFVLEDNPDDKANISLRIPEDEVENAIKFGVDIQGHEVSFEITKKDPLPESLVVLFCFLLKNSSESVITLRNKLEGLKYLSSILQQKIDGLKPVKVDGSIDPRVVKNTKIYRNAHKQFFQLCYEKCTSLEKQMLKEYKPLSFKTIFKTDKAFANALLLIFGITSYEQLSKTDDLDRVIILWLIRCGNKKAYNEKNLFPDFILDTYQEVSKTVTVTRKDIQDNIPIYKALFPSIADKVPEVFGKGDWSIKQFVIAEEVRDKLCFERKTSREVLFLQNIRV